MRKIKSVGTDFQVWSMTRKAPKSRLKPILVSLGMVFLSHCGEDPKMVDPIASETFENTWEGMVEYTPLNILEIEKAVGLKNNLNLQDFKDIHFLKGSKHDTTVACNNANAAACAKPENNAVLIGDFYQDLCVLLAHELTHIALFKTTGNARNDHMNEQFEENFDLCNQIGANK